MSEKVMPQNPSAELVAQIAASLMDPGGSGDGLTADKADEAVFDALKLIERSGLAVEGEESSIARAAVRAAGKFASRKFRTEIDREEQDLLDEATENAAVAMASRLNGKTYLARLRELGLPSRTQATATKWEKSLFGDYAGEPKSHPLGISWRCVQALKGDIPSIACSRDKHLGIEKEVPNPKKPPNFDPVADSHVLAQIEKFASLQVEEKNEALSENLKESGKKLSRHKSAKKQREPKDY